MFLSWPLVRITVVLAVISSRTGTAAPFANSFNNGYLQCPIKEHQTYFCHDTVHAVCAPAIDDQIFSAAETPWTHRPSCVRGSARDGGEALQKYCTFSAAFFGDHGISLIASPETAAHAVSALDSIYHSRFPSVDTVVNITADRPFAITDIPGKGKGVVATRRILQHETFMIDYSALMIDANLSKVLKPEQRRDCRG
ncbi:hypothetical protein BR93DRAFT_324495 [Coniochaeta sp. PMI_546]|nr:hypothetical protein BR93DRAFT_324495 [Coniochaeta sp. PMI_546]